MKKQKKKSLICMNMPPLLPHSHPHLQTCSPPIGRVGHRAAALAPVQGLPVLISVAAFPQTRMIGLGLGPAA